MQAFDPRQQQAQLEHHRASLLAHQGLDASDLDAMRAGRMSPGALRAIAKGASAGYILIVAGGVVGALGLGLGFVMLRAFPAEALAIAGVRLTVPMLVGPLAAFIMILSGVLTLRRIARAGRLAIVVIEGIATRGVGRKGRRYLAVAGTQLYEHHQPVVRGIAERLVPGAPIRVFLTENEGLSSGIVVGIEPLPAPPTSAGRSTSYAGSAVIS